MKKDNFFEWIRNFDERDLIRLKRYSNLLFKTPRQFLMLSSREIQAWKLGKKPNSVSISMVVKRLKKRAKKMFGDSTQAIRRLKDFIHTFIINSHIENNSQLKYQLLFKAMQKYDYSDAYFHILDKRQIANDNQENRSYEYWFEKYDIEYQRYFSVNFEKYSFDISKNDKRFKLKDTLHKSWENLQLSYWIKQYQLALEIEFVRQIKLNPKTKKENTPKDEPQYDLHQINLSLLEENFAKFNLPSSVVLNIYRSLYQWVIAKDWKKSKELIAIIDLSLENIKLFSFMEQSIFLIMLINCLSKSYVVIKDKKEVIRQIVRVGKFGFEKNIFSKVDENVFLNIYNTAYHVDADFCIKMKTTYIHCLPTVTDKEWCKVFMTIKDLAKDSNYPEILYLLGNLKHHNNFRLALRYIHMQVLYFYEFSEAIQQKEVRYSDIEKELVLPYKFRELKANISQKLNAAYFESPSEEIKNQLKRFIAAVSKLYYKTASMSEMKLFIDEAPIYGYQWILQKIEERKKIEMNK